MGLIQRIPQLTQAIPQSLFCMNEVNANFHTLWPPPWNVHAMRTFKGIWSKVELTQGGGYDFTLLDVVLDRLLPEGIEPLVVISNPAIWMTSAAEIADDLPAYEAYLRALMAHVKHKVVYFELWNEAESFDLGSSNQYFFHNIDKLVLYSQVAYDVIKELNANAIVVSPAMNLNHGGQGLTLMQMYLAAGGADYCDVIGFHSYVAPNAPETLIDRVQPLVDTVRSLGIEKPMWNTETGWNILNEINNDFVGSEFAGAGIDPNVMQGWLIRAYILCWMMGVERYYYYGYDHRGMGFLGFNLNYLKSTALGYIEAQKWLIGRSVVSVVEDDVTGVWTVKLQTNDVVTDYIVWTTGTPVKQRVNPEWVVNRVVDSAGKITTLTEYKKTIFTIMSNPQRLYLEKGEQTDVESFF